MEAAVTLIDKTVVTSSVTTKDFIVILVLELALLRVVKLFSDSLLSSHCECLSKEMEELAFATSTFVTFTTLHLAHYRLCLDLREMNHAGDKFHVLLFRFAMLCIAWCLQIQFKVIVC